VSETDRVIARQRDRFGDFASAADHYVLMLLDLRLMRAAAANVLSFSCDAHSITSHHRRRRFRHRAQTVKAKKHKGLQRWRPCTHSRNRESKTAEPFVPFFGHRKSKGRWAWAATETLGGTHSRCKEGVPTQSRHSRKKPIGPTPYADDGVVLGCSLSIRTSLDCSYAQRCRISTDLRSRVASHSLHTRSVTY